MTERTLYGKELRALRWVWIVGLIILVAIGAVLGPVHDFLVQLLGEASIPPQYSGLLQRTVFQFESYLWLNWYAKNLLQLVVILAVLIAAGALAGEAGRGTLEFLLARPVSRSQVVWAKAAAGLTVLWSITVVSTVTTVLGGIAAGYPLQWGRFLLGVPNTLTALVVIYGIVLVFSALTADLIRAGVVGALALLPLSIAGWFQRSAWLSPFHYMRAIGVFAGRGLPYLALTVMLLVGLGLIWLAGRLFGGRDV